MLYDDKLSRARGEVRLIMYDFFNLRKLSPFSSQKYLLGDTVVFTVFFLMFILYRPSVDPWLPTEILLSKFLFREIHTK